MTEASGKQTPAETRLGPFLAALAGRGAAGPAMDTPPANALQAFRSLFYQHWRAPPPDQHGLRRLSALSSLLLHLALLIGFWFLFSLPFAAPAPDDAAGEGGAIQVVFLDADATAAEIAPVASGVPAEDAATTPTPVADPARPSAPAQPVQPVQAAGETSVQDQPLEVTQVPEPDIDFQLPPTRIVELDAPDLRSDDVALRSREIEVVERVQLPGIQVPAPEQDAPVPRLQGEVEVVERRIAEVPREVRLSEVPLSEVPPPALQTPVLRPSEPQLRERRPDVVERAPPAPVSSEPSPAVAAESAPAVSAPAPVPATPAAPAPVPAEGQGRPAVADEWSRAPAPGRPGGGSGLFDADGRPRLAGDGRAGGGLPPGTVTEDFERIDRHGTWLRRPSTAYRSSAFEELWMPSEDLLQEWVRRSIQTVLIPIPGTTKTIECRVALLAVAGGCRINDPNMQDIEAEARPPPDIPFRPELHEDQQSLRQPVEPTGSPGQR